MKNFIAVTMIIALLPAFALAAQKKKAAQPAAAAADSSEPSATVNPITPNQGSDSCGLGWQVTPKRTIIATTTRGTTNYVIPPSFGMTSGTMGCYKHEFTKNEQSAVQFASVNYDSLKMEMAQGKGEFLTTFAQTLGCSNGSTDSFSHMTQSKFDSLTQGTAVDFYKGVKEEIKNDPALSASCGV